MQIKIKNNLKRRATSLIKRQSLSNPLDFLSPKRIDIAAKTIYAKAYLEANSSDWPEHVYKEHIRAFNNFYEAEPLKENYSDFKKSFHHTLDNIEKLHEWSHLAPVWVNEVRLINGSHRVAAAITSKQAINSVHKPLTNHNTYDYNFFNSNRDNIKKIDEEVLDYMTIEYVSLKKQNIFAAIIFPAAEGHRKQAYDHLSSMGEIINMKSFPYDAFVGKEVIKQLYFDSNNDAWNYGNDFQGAINKSQGCFNGKGNLEVYLIEANLDESTRIKEKEYLRELWKKEKHSIHISDTVEEANRIVRMFFNKNSRDFMANDRYSEFKNENSRSLFDLYCKSLPDDIHEREKFAIEGSFVFDIYGLREAKDLDYISRSKNTIPTTQGIERHLDNENVYHDVSLDEILTNPKYYFYYKGYKVITLNQMKDYKQRRFVAEKDPKDSSDIKLIERFQAKNAQSNLPKQPLISIVVPVYNVDQFLDTCVQSILNQTYKNIEIVLVDDGSTDTSGKKCNHFGKKHQNIKVIHKKNAGLNMARKSGLDVASGDYVLFVDSDDSIHPETIEALYRAMSTHNVDIATGAYKYFSDEAEIATHQSIKHVSPLFEYDKEVLKKWLIRGAPYDNIFMQTAWMKLFRKEMLLSINWEDFNYRSNEDEFMALQYYQNINNGMAFILEPLYYYRINNNSITRSKYINNFKGTALSKFKMIDSLYTKTISEFGSKFKNDALIRFIQQYLIFSERYLEEGWLDSSAMHEFDELVIPKLPMIDEVYAELSDHHKKQYDYIKQHGLFGIAMFGIHYRDGIINELQAKIDEKETIITELQQPGVKTSLRKLVGSTRRYVHKKLKTNN